MLLRCKRCEELTDKIESLSLENSILKRKLKMYEDNKLKNFYTYQKIKKHRLNIDIWEIDDYKKMGMSNTKIAKLLNVSEGTIRNRLKEVKEIKERNKLILY